MSESPRASVVLVNKDGIGDLPDCLSSLRRQTMDDFEVILVDNDSTDGSVDYVRSNFPEVRIIENGMNHWYAGGSEDGIAVAKGEYYVVANVDVEFDDEWLERLVAPFDRDESPGVTTSKVVQFDERDRINTCGLVAHVSGLGFRRASGKTVTTCNDQEDIAAFSGCAFAIPRRVYDDIGGFDPVFEYYYEDVDLSWRVRLAGYDIELVSDSVVFHKYEDYFPRWRFFNMERNRWLILLSHLQIRTLFTLLPVLVVTQIALVGYGLTRGPGYPVELLRAMLWLFQNYDVVREKRATVQSLRRRTDRKLLASMTTELPAERFGLLSPVVAVLNEFYAVVYGRLYG